MKISAAIITYNEANNIGRCLQSLKLVADEIVVLDSNSKDETVNIAKAAGAMVFNQEFLGHIAQKNKAISYTQFDYVLSLDADEALDETLIQELLKIKNKPAPAKAYTLNRYNNYCGQWINFGAWRSDKKIRLFDKHIGKWGGKNPHDKIEIPENIQALELKGNLLHWSYTSIEEHRNKIENYAAIAAKAYHEAGKKSSSFKIVLSPVFRFTRDYLFKLGFLDGKNGLLIATLTAKEVYLKYKKLRDLNKGQ